jgi:hypothetical protein
VKGEEMSVKAALAFLIGIAALALPACAQKTDLSGTWKLNLAKSFMATEHPASNYQLTRVIEQKEGHIVISDSAVNKKILNIPVPDATTRLEIAFDGKEQEIQVPGFLPFLPPVKEYLTAQWQGGTLDLQEREVNGAGYAERRLFLSEDGSELIVLVRRRDTYSEIEQRMVFDKQH